MSDSGSVSLALRCGPSKAGPKARATESAFHSPQPPSDASKRLSGSPSLSRWLQVECPDQPVKIVRVDLQTFCCIVVVPPNLLKHVEDDLPLGLDDHFMKALDRPRRRWGADGGRGF